LYFEVLNTEQAPLKSQNSKKLVLLEETKEKCKVHVSPEFECQTQLNYVRKEGGNFGKTGLDLPFFTAVASAVKSVSARRKFLGGVFCAAGLSQL
jgi:hypothetical protein